MKKASFSVFVNPRIEKQLENGPLLRATGQVIVFQEISEKGNNKTYTADVEIMDMDEIVLMGVSIVGCKEQKATIDHFKNMGINLYDVMNKEMEEYVVGYGDLKTFVFEETGIQLP